MKYLSLFSGIWGFELGILKHFPDAECVGYSEIDKYADTIYRSHFPDHTNFGDVSMIDIQNLPDFDLLVGGSPCQDLSIAKNNRQGLQGARSGLFYKYLEVLRTKKPKYFILENVASMPKEAKDDITQEMGVEPIMINAALVSAQNRKRLFWTNIPGVVQPEDRHIYLKDILEDGQRESVALRNRGDGKKPEYNGTNKANSLTTVQTDSMVAIIQTPRGYNKGGVHTDKSPTLSSNAWEQNNKLQTKSKTIRTSGMGSGYGDRHNWDMITEVRKLTPIECERLQCFPDNRTQGVSNTRRYKGLGNAVNVEVVAHIMSFLLTSKVDE